MERPRAGNLEQDTLAACICFTLPSPLLERESILYNIFAIKSFHKAKLTLAGVQAHVTILEDR